MTKGTILAPKKPHKCRRCGGSTCLEDGIFKCLSCGEEEVDKHQRHEFLESNKMEILRDVLAIGPAKTQQKWGLPPLTWQTLKHRWQLRKVWWAPGMHLFQRDGLPRLPAWRNDWPPELKLKWLETYQLIVESKK